nr:hypothetical protein GTC16762_13140 [Pigmentibacter ruber]
MQSTDQENVFVSKLNITSIILSLIGFSVSLYSLIVHLQVTLKSSGKQLCDFNSTVSCSAVIGSSYGEIASIPLGAYGMTFFAILFSAAILPKFTQVTKKWLAQLELMLAGLGFLSVICLAYISYFKLQLVCPACSIVHITVLLYSTIKVFEFIKVKNTPVGPKNDAFIRFMAVSLCLGLPPLAIGLLAPIIAPYFFSSSDKTSPTSNVTNTQASNINPSNVEQINNLMSFNKTNFVGNGEDYRRGSDTAKVVVQVFSDFGCPHCRIATEGMTKAQDAFGLEKVVIVYKFFPFSNKCNPHISHEGVYPYSCTLAEAARCVGQQGKFWEFKTWAFEGQTWNNAQRAENFSLDGLKKHVGEMGLNINAFEQCMNSHVEVQKLKDDAGIANKLGIEGTPLIYINGQQYNGEHSAEAFMQAFSQAYGK